MAGAEEVPKYPDYFDIIDTKEPQRARDPDAWNQYASEVLILIHTVNDNEYWAAVDHMEPPENESHCVIYKHGAVLGTFGGFKTALVQTKMGHGCQNEIERALDDFRNVQAIVAVGVAYASSKKYKFADVLVSTHIEDLVNLKFTKDDKIFTRGVKHEISQPLVDTFCKQKDVWAVRSRFVRTDSASNHKAPKIYPGIMLSAPWLVDNAEIKDKLLDQAPEAVGGEMEGGILLRMQTKLFEQTPPRKIGWIVIKGVADYADGSKGKNWQFTAAMAAVGFAEFQLKRNGDFKLPAPPSTTVQGDGRVAGASGGSTQQAQGKSLGVGDLKEVKAAVRGARAKWKELGLQLGLHIDDLNDIEGKNNEERLSNMLEVWLAKASMVRTWSALVNALREPEVGREDIAAETASAHGLQ